MEIFERRSSLVCLQITIFIISTLIIAVQSQQGFLSIDCGSNEDYYDNVTGIYWQKDAHYISTGKSVDNIKTASPYFILNTRQLSTLRYFDDPRRSRDCYVLPTRPQRMYLFRPGFFYGNWSDASSATSFTIYLNGTLSYSIQYDGAYLNYLYWLEVIFYSPGSVINICLVRQQGTSFISTLELRILGTGMYAPASVPLDSQPQYFELWFRWNCGIPRSKPQIRYPDDKYDRIWSYFGYTDNATHIRSSNISASTSTLAPDQPPLKVMEDAWVYYKQPFLFVSIDNGGRPVGSVYVTMYFQEVDGNASATDVRGMEYYLNDNFVKSFNSSSQALEIDGPIQNITDNFFYMNLVQASWSSLVPILNAMEIYKVFDFNVSRTAVEDLEAITALQRRLNLLDWSGDPCVPKPFDWMDCTADSNDPILARVTNLALRGNAISGSIPLEIFNLTSLTNLSMNDNNLTGSIPNFRGLALLETLDFSHNDLTGPFDIYGDLYISNSSNLKLLNLDHNSINGTLILSSWHSMLQDVVTVNSSDISSIEMLFSLVNNNIEDIYPPAEDFRKLIEILMHTPGFKKSGFLLGGNPYCQGEKTWAQKYFCRYSVFDQISECPKRDKNSLTFISAIIPRALSFIFVFILIALSWQLWREARILQAIQKG